MACAGTAPAAAAQYDRDHQATGGPAGADIRAV